ncbi:MAG: hypothetical protein ACYC5N_05845 [Endomicrobiales bacterium]
MNESGSARFSKQVRTLLVAAAALSVSAGAAFAFHPSPAAYVPPEKTAAAKTSKKKAPSAAALREWSAFNKKHNDRWSLRTNKETGLPEALTGFKSEKLAGPPEQAARSFLKKNQAFLGVDTAGIAVEKILSARGKNHLRYRQAYRGVRVENAETTVHLSPDNEVIAVYSRYRPGIDLDVTPAVSGEAAFIAVKKRMGLSQDPARRKPPELVILPRAGAYTLCWKVRFFTSDPLGSWVHYVDAKTGEIVAGFNDLRFAVSGTVTAQVFPKYGSDTLRVEAVPGEYVCVNGSTVTTNARGEYSAAGAGAVTSSLQGPWVKAVNEDYPSVSYAGAVSAWTWQYAPQDTHFDEVQLFFHLNFIHDYFKETLGLGAMDYQMTGTAHAGSQYNNAYYDPDDGNVYFGDGDGSSFLPFSREAGIIYHEYTHGVQDHLYYLEYLGQSGAMMEAWSDYFGASIFDEPRVGAYVSLGVPFRNLDNAARYPEDLAGEVHDDSVIFSGALWDMRKALGRVLSDRLVFDSWYYQPYDFRSGLEALLMADDDDGDLSNGTPHEAAIREAFTKHGITTAGSANTAWEEPNNDFLTANGPLASGTTYQPFLYSEGDQDYFKVYADAGGLSVRLTAIPSGHDYDLYLYDADSRLIGESLKENNQNELISTTTVRGVYYARVISFTGSSLSTPYSLCATFTAAPADATPPAAAPPVPSDGGAYGGADLTFSWSQGGARDPESGISAYSLKVGTAPGDNNVFEGDLGNVTGKKISGCLSGLAYYACVRAKNGAGLYGPWSAASDGVVVDTTPPSGAPGVPAVQNPATNSTALTFSWDAGTSVDTESGIEGYWLQVSTFPGAPLNAKFDAYAGDVLSKAVYDCANGVSYYARVRARNAAGSAGEWSAWSSSVIVDFSLITAAITLTPAPPLKSGAFQVTLTIDSLNDIAGKPGLSYRLPDGTDVALDLSGSNKTWSAGSYIESTAPEGTATFSFSAVDVINQAGSGITAGRTFSIQTTLEAAAGGTVSNRDRVSVYVPPGAATENLNIRITSPAAGDAALTAANARLSDDTGARRIRTAALERQFTAQGAVSGSAITRFTQPVTISLPYPDDDNDGLVDGTALNERGLRVFYLNEAGNEWVLEPAATVDAAANIVSAPVNHFSVFTLMALERPAMVSEAFVYPNPCSLNRDSYLRIGNIPLDARNVKVYIYTPALELVRTLEEGRGIEDQAYSRVARWDGRNENNEKVASGVYLCLIKSDGGKKIEKAAVFW